MKHEKVYNVYGTNKTLGFQNKYSKCVHIISKTWLKDCIFMRNDILNYIYANSNEVFGEFLIVIDIHKTHTALDGI